MSMAYKLNQKQYTFIQKTIPYELFDRYNIREVLTNICIHRRYTKAEQRMLMDLRKKYIKEYVKSK